MTPTTTQLLGDASGVRPTFDFEGVTYRVGHPTQAAKARYESLIVAAEKDVIARMAAAGDLTDAERRDAYATLTRRVAYEGGGGCGTALWAEYFAGDKARVGTALWLLSMLEVPDGAGGFRPGAVGELAAAVRMAGDEAAALAFAEVLPPFLALLLSALPPRMRDTPEVVAALAKLAPTTPPTSPS